MELYIRILADYFAKHGYLDELVDGNAIVQDRCYQTLCQIKAILDDESLSDPTCFQKIEEVICTLEKLGIGVGSRHDFG